jgi:hypothetical protein
MELPTCDCQFARKLKGYGRMRYIAKQEFKENISLIFRIAKFKFILPALR